MHYFPVPIVYNYKEKQGGFPNERNETEYPH